jgi:hypothetical protein
VSDSIPQRLPRLRLTYWQNHQGGCYFRIFGYGLAFAFDESPRFSERMKVRRVLRIGRLSCRVLYRREIL